MWIGLAIIGYIGGVFFLIRFFQSVASWDKDIERMEASEKRTSRIS